MKRLFALILGMTILFLLVSCKKELDANQTSGKESEAISAALKEEAAPEPEAEDPLVPVPSAPNNTAAVSTTTIAPATTTSKPRPTTTVAPTTTKIVPPTTTASSPLPTPTPPIESTTKPTKLFDPDPHHEAPANLDKYEDEYYIYFYNATNVGTGGFLLEENYGGWNVVGVKDRTLSSYPSLPETIYGKPITALSATYNGCYNLTKAPAIPTTVTRMDSTFANCAALVDLSDFVIPESVIDLSTTFSDCTALVSAPVIPKNATILSGTFQNCTNLTGTVEINAMNIDPFYCGSCFYRTEKLISLVGDCPNEIKTLLASSAKQGNVTF